MQIGWYVATRLALLIGFVVLTASPSRAVEITLDVFLGGSSVGSLNASQLGCTDSGVTAVCQVQNVLLGDVGGVGGILLTNVDLSLDTDPVVSGEIAVQNMAVTAQEILLLVSLNVAPVGPSSLTGGSMAGGVTDNDGNTATLSTLSGSAFYTALIDGVAYQTLAPHSTVVSVLNPFESANLEPAPNFGTPIPSQAGPPVATKIGLQYHFELSALDAASFTGVFVVQPIPEPGTAALLGLGLVVLAGAQRRR